MRSKIDVRITLHTCPGGLRNSVRQPKIEPYEGQSLTATVNNSI